MPRTTVDIDAPIFREIQALRKKTGLSLGQIISRLLAEVLRSGEPNKKSRAFRWTSRPMQALVEPSDKDTVYGVNEPDKK